MYVVSRLSSEVLKTIVKIVETGKKKKKQLKLSWICWDMLVLTILHVPVTCHYWSKGVTAHVNERKRDSLEINTMEG